MTVVKRAGQNLLNHGRNQNGCQTALLLLLIF
jgi:hypothetical protein